MILSVSRRTDIPAFYPVWFLNRVREGFVYVRNPMNYYQVSRISLDPKVIDCIVFWSKNPAPLIPSLGEIEEKYPFYFQYTLNAYGRDIEPGLPEIEEKISTFKKLSEMIGRERVIWRYDPVLLSDKYTVGWHIDAFEHLAGVLQGFTQTCVFSFVDLYDKVKSNTKGYGIKACSFAETDALAHGFSEIAKKYGLSLRTCAEKVDLDRYGIQHGCCIDGELISKITGCKLTAAKDPTQRPECGCLESVDIGQYNTCRHGCRYCYANYNPALAAGSAGRHDPMSPFLIGGQDEKDKVTERKMKSLKKYPDEQISMF